MKMPCKRPWSEKLERVFIRFLAAVAALVMLTQVILSEPSKQAMLPAGAPDRPQTVLKDSAGILQGYIVTLHLKNYSSLPMARVLVNGEPRGEFRDRYVTVFVQEGDLLEVDGTRYNRPMDIEVLDTSKEIILPAAGTAVRVEGSVRSLGQVRMDR